MGSSKFQLDKTDLSKLGKGLLIAAGGAILTYLSSWASSTDFGTYTPAVVAMLAVVVNFGRKYMADNNVVTGRQLPGRSWLPPAKKPFP